MATAKKKTKKRAKAREGQESGVPHACVEREVPPNLVGKAITTAVKERGDNIMMPSMALPMGTNANRINAPAMALVTKKLWKPGRKIKVKFLDSPSKKVKDAIETFAHEWEQHADIKFVFSQTGFSDIRITTKPGGSWSYLGTDALTIPSNRATMNYGWFTDTTPQDEFSRTTLHEFGHALGCIHEHNHPKNGIPWDKPKVYAYYKKTQGWSKEDVDAQVFGKYSATQLNASDYDRLSIMHYAVPREHTIGGFEVGWNRKLSARDKTFIAQQY